MKPAALTFEEVQKDQLHLLTQVAKNTFITAFETQNNPEDFHSYISEAFAPERLQREWSNKHSTFYFCKLQKTLIGYFKTNIADAQTEFREKMGMELERIYVLSDYQNQGFGKQILDYVVQLANGMGKSYLWLGVWQENPRALSFYEAYGFQKIGTHPYDIGKDRQTDWLLRKNI